MCGRPCNGWVVDEGPVGCVRCLQLMQSKPNVNTINQDPSGHWRTRCGQLADRLGYSRTEVWRHWSQIALQIEFEARIKRPLAEMKAFDLVLASLDKQGAVPS